MSSTVVVLESNAFFLWIEYIAMFCCGMVGGLNAVRKGYDMVAILITTWLTALGGGIIRDVMLGAFPPVGIADRGFVLVALAAGLTVMVIYPEVDSLRRTMLTLDALALGLFAVNGTEKALQFGTSGMTAVFMGLFTALGGGLVRDMLLNEVPMVIRDRHWYAVPSAIGCCLTVAVYRALQAGWITPLWQMVADAAIVLLVVGLRLASVHFNVNVPGAVTRHHTYVPRRKL